MAVLSEADRVVCWENWMRDNKAAIIGAMTRQELRAAVDALDTWLNDNAAAANNALPLPARTVLTQSQKAALLTIIVYRRYGAGA